MDIREDRAWLLRSRVSPAPIPGSLALADHRISFTLDAAAAEVSLDWLCEQLGDADLETRIRAGEAVVAFDHPLDQVVVSWPITGSGAICAITTAERRWVVSHDGPTGRGMAQALNVVAGRGRVRDWKRALAESGA